MQFTIKDKTFDSGRLNAFQQLHVVRRSARHRAVALAGDMRATLKPSSARQAQHRRASCPTPMWTTF